MATLTPELIFDGYNTEWEGNQLYYTGGENARLELQEEYGLDEEQFWELLEEYREQSLDAIEAEAEKWEDYYSGIRPGII